MKIADFRIQTGVPSDRTPSAGVVGLYASPNTGLTLLTSNGANIAIGSTALQMASGLLIPGANDANTSFTVTSGPGTITTGSVWGASGQNQKGMGTPHYWLPFVGISGEKLAVPAYLYT